MHLNFITAPVHCRFQWPIILFNVLSSATKDCSTFFLTLLTRGLLTFSFSRLVKVIKFQSCPSLRQHLHLMHTRTKLDFVWLPKGLIVPLQLISRYFFLRSKSSKAFCTLARWAAGPSSCMTPPAVLPTDQCRNACHRDRSATCRPHRSRPGRAR